MSAQSNRPKKRSIQLTQYDIVCITAVFHETNNARQTPGLTARPRSKDLKALDEFGEELIAAIDRHPTVTTRELMEIAFSVYQPPIELMVSEEILCRFFVACKNLDSHDGFVTVRPFMDMLGVAKTWFSDADFDPLTGED
ncbi:hypothetical protein [Haloarchaeobius sp. TZWSO28]|uniref:hypothetical protein n=1 Tax=Haloarchaeobius sp. TZWSO28 TaxID=3446119 RepID=UPI003EC045AE